MAGVEHTRVEGGWALAGSTRTDADPWIEYMSR